MIESLYSFQASGCGEAPRSEARPYVCPTVIVHDLLKTLNLVAPEHLYQEYDCEHDVASADSLFPNRCSSVLQLFYSFIQVVGGDALPRSQFGLGGSANRSTCWPTVVTVTNRRDRRDQKT